MTGQSGPTATPICDPQHPHPCPVFTSSDAVARAQEAFAFSPTGVTTRLVSAQTVYASWLGSEVVSGMDPAEPMWIVALEGVGLTMLGVMPPVFMSDQSAASELTDRPVGGAYAVFESYGGMMLLHGVLELPGSSDPLVDGRYTLSAIQALTNEQLPIITATPIY